MDDPMQLLREWMDWWQDDDDAPAKLPNALQVRTALVLAIETDWRPRDYNRLTKGHRGSS